MLKILDIAVYSPIINVINAKVFPVSKEMPKDLEVKIEQFKKRAPGKKKEVKPEENKEEKK